MDASVLARDNKSEASYRDANPRAEEQSYSERLRRKSPPMCPDDAATSYLVRGSALQIFALVGCRSTANRRVNPRSSMMCNARLRG
jgi:hypothetical protein